MAPRTIAKPRYRCKKTTDQSSIHDVPNPQSTSSPLAQPQSVQPSGSLPGVTETPALDSVPFSGPSPFPPFMEAPRDTPTLPPPGYGSWDDSTFQIRDARATNRPSAQSTRLSHYRSILQSPRMRLPGEPNRPQSMNGSTRALGTDVPTSSSPTATRSTSHAVHGPTTSSATDVPVIPSAMIVPTRAPATEEPATEGISTSAPAIPPLITPGLRWPAVGGLSTSSPTDAHAPAAIPTAGATRPQGNRVTRTARSSPRIAPPPIAQRIASRDNHGARPANTVNQQAAIESLFNLLGSQDDSISANHAPILTPPLPRTRPAPVPVIPDRAPATPSAIIVPQLLPPSNNINSGARPADTVDLDAERGAHRVRLSRLRDLFREFHDDNLADVHRRHGLPTTLGEYQDAMTAAFEAGKAEAAKEARLKQARDADNSEAALALRYSRSCAVCLISPNPLVRIALTGCGHIMCSPCAEQLAKVGSKVACPFCRKAGDTLRLFEDIEEKEGPTTSRCEANDQPETSSDPIVDNRQES